MLIEHFFFGEKLPVIGRATNVDLHGLPYSVWNFYDAEAAEKFRLEFGGIDVASMGDAWLKAHGAKSTNEVTTDRWH